jgi:hypothetical protein
MRMLAALAAAPLVLGALAVPAAAEEQLQDPSPSTNAANKDAGWAYFDATPATDSVLLVLSSARDLDSCFEYRAEDSAPVPDATHDNELVTDGVFESVCVRDEVKQVTVEAEEYVEVRLVSGTDPAERFDWTRVDVAAGDETPGETPENTPTRPGNLQDCKRGGWRSLGYQNQGKCVSDVRKRDNQARKQLKAEHRATAKAHGKAAKAHGKATKKVIKPSGKPARVTTR